MGIVFLNRVLFWFSRYFCKKSAFFLLLGFLLIPGLVPASAATITSPVVTPSLPITSYTEKTASDAVPFEATIRTAETGSAEMISSSSRTSDAVPCVSTYIKDFTPDVAGGTEDIFSKRNLPIVIVGGTLTAAAASIDHLDRNAKNYFQTRRPLDGVSKYGSQIGEGYVHVGVAAALLGIGELSNDKKLADTGVVTLEALLVNGTATEVLKYAVERRRPNGGDKFSFPSGHSSSTATLAASISAMYDWDLRLAIPLYSVALFAGASRMQDNEHYLSDVIGGLTLGTLVGSSFAHYHKEKESQTSGLRSVSVAPVIDKDIKGALFTFKW